LSLTATLQSGAGLIERMLSGMPTKLGCGDIALRCLERKRIMFKLCRGGYATGSQLGGTFEVGAGAGNEHFGTFVQSRRFLDGGLCRTNTLLELLSHAWIKQWRDVGCYRCKRLADLHSVAGAQRGAGHATGQWRGQHEAVAHSRSPILLDDCGEGLLHDRRHLDENGTRSQHPVGPERYQRQEARNNQVMSL
jgi:hypothetical protein